jgi:hypothetical protein
MEAMAESSVKEATGRRVGDLGTASQGKQQSQRQLKKGCLQGACDNQVAARKKVPFEKLLTARGRRKGGKRETGEW